MLEVHENVLKFHEYKMSTAIQGCDLDSQKYEQKVGMIVTELAENGAFFEYISQCGGLSEELTRTFGL